MCYWGSRSVTNEYNELFKLMTTVHPRRRDLATSSTFRGWMATNQPNETQGVQGPTVSPSTISRPPRTDIINQAFQGALAEEIPIQNNEQKQDIEHLPSPAEQDTPENNQNLNVVDDIVDQMMMNEDLRNILEQPQPAVDEGIELNIFDEIEFDIEPLDYSLEVEPYDF